MPLYCAQIDDATQRQVCTDSLAAKAAYERIGLAISSVPASDDGACRPGHPGDCPAGHTCTPRFAHANLPNAFPTHCQPNR